MQHQHNFEFERFVRNAVAKNMAGSIVGLIILCLLALFFLGFGFAMLFVPIIIVGLIPAGGIFLMLYRFKGDLKGSDYWINQLTMEPAKIVWITPVNIRHTAGYVFTLYNEMNFQILNSDGLKILIKCDERRQQLMFLYGLKQYVPHAHFGFSDRVEYYYKENPQTFLHELYANGLYAPVYNLDLGHRE